MHYTTPLQLRLQPRSLLVAVGALYGAGHASIVFRIRVVEVILAFRLDGRNGQIDVFSVDTTSLRIEGTVDIVLLLHDLDLGVGKRRHFFGNESWSPLSQITVSKDDVELVERASFCLRIEDPNHRAEQEERRR